MGVLIIKNKILITHNSSLITQQKYHMNIKNISVIGAGTMGNGIAHVFAQAGFNVTIVDVSLAQLDKAVANIGKNFDRQVAKGIVTEEQKATALANITTESNIIEGVKDNI